MKRLITFSLFMFAILAFTLSTFAQNISVSPNEVTKAYGQIQYAPTDATTITHSIDPVTVTALMSVACTNGGITSDNQYWRSFVLADFGITDDFAVTVVEVGIETATAGSGGEQPMTVNLYTADTPWPTLSLTPIGTASVMVPDQALTLFQIPVTGTAPGGSELVVEISIPDATTGANHTFFLGANNFGQTADSWLSADGCGLPGPPVGLPVTTASIGFPDAMWVMSVTGDVGGGGGTITIAEAIEDLNGDFVPDRLGQTVTVQGVVFSPNYQTTNNSFYIDDGTAGTDIFMFGPPVFIWAMGDMLTITGEVDQFNGMTEIIPADSSGWVFVSSGNPTPDPIVLTLAQYKADPEAYEGSLVGFVSLDLVDGTWPASGSTNLDFSDGIDTVTFRIDSDTDIPGQPEPTWPQDILGIGSQFDSSTPPDGGYQIFPRYYALDFLPPGTIPVELTSFTAQVSNRVVTLNWTTATELNNQMFEIERRSEDGQYIMIGYVNGHGTTTELHDYSYIDNNVETGTFFYRLKQIDFGGRYAYSDVVQVDVVAPAKFTLEQNYPNPFNPSTKITFNLAVDSKVSLKVFDVLGQEVTNLVTTNMTAGVYEVNFDAANLNSGVYFYRLNATGVDGTNFTSVKKMILTK